MNQDKTKLLNETLNRTINIVMGFEAMDHLENFFATKLMIIGTAADEKYTSLAGLRKLIKNQQEQTKGMDVRIARSELYRDCSADENIAIIVEDITIFIAVNDESTQVNVRASTVLEFKNHQWKLIHWHVSKPDLVESEVDTFGIDEWKRKNEELEKLVAERTNDLVLKNQELEITLTQLKSTQAQLIQKEKLASLGELTAGIAHEIQNPLNFVNNFSEVSTELVSELKDELDRGALDRGDTEEAKAIADDLTQNLQKITHHGRRASSIVKGMLEHSRTSTDERQPTDLNALADEYLRLAYHGLRANRKDFNCELVTDFAPGLGRVSLVPADIGRVLLNLFNNAFYAVSEKSKLAPDGYHPTVSVSTKRTASGVDIRVSDNGTGIPDTVKARIFQPFFTTKPTGEGTGLGLSLSYDIVTKGHGGTLTVESTAGAGTEFSIHLPIQPA